MCFGTPSIDIPEPAEPQYMRNPYLDGAGALSFLRNQRGQGGGGLQTAEEYTIGFDAASGATLSSADDVYETGGSLGTLGFASGAPGSTVRQAKESGGSSGSSGGPGLSDAFADRYKYAAGGLNI